MNTHGNQARAIWTPKSTLPGLGNARLIALILIPRFWLRGKSMDSCEQLNEKRPWELSVHIPTRAGGLPHPAAIGKP